MRNANGLWNEWRMSLLEKTVAGISAALPDFRRVLADFVDLQKTIEIKML